MRYLLILTITTVSLLASLLDFKYLEEAKDAYRDKNYAKAQKLYARIEGDEAKFNMANSLYRQKKYQEAIEVYRTITDPKLEAKKLHNIGNSHVHMKKIDKAIHTYEKALKLKKDADTQFNLALLKKKKNREEDKNKKNKKDKQTDRPPKIEPPISNMEERKWQKMLDQRGVKTLMIPLNKKERQHDKNPW